ncbi:MAG: hypothetical protein M1813_002735 [Trichoglossum hirsutum]|nr:MAG: hypothetical protein M1813_002735 [Trichoglossum hirsutum]
MNGGSSYLTLSSRSSPRGDRELSVDGLIERQLSDLYINPLSPRSPSNYSRQGGIKSIGEEEEGENKREEKPQEPLFNRRIQHALKSGITVSGDIADALDGLKDTSFTLSQLWEDATALRDYESPTTHIVGVVWGSGTGKSSLVNSLLDQHELATTSDIGSACTNIVTEYRHKTNKHTAPFTIEVDYLSDKEIHSLLYELLWNYH